MTALLGLTGDNVFSFDLTNAYVYSMSSWGRKGNIDEVDCKFFEAYTVMSE